MIGGYFPPTSDCHQGIIDTWTDPFAFFPFAFFDELDPDVRAAQSVWSRLPDGAEESAIARFASDLNSGKWDEAYGDVRRRSTFKGALKLIRNLPDEPRGQGSK